MKYWSSASSLATRTASPCPRRPARPHCWRMLATVPGKPTEITASSMPTSIPSSSAFVALTPRSSPANEALLDLAALRGRVAGAVGREPGGVAEAVGRELVDQLGGAAALREHERAQAALDEVGHQLRRLGERARPLAQLLVDQRRVPERDRPLGLRRSVLADHGEVEARQVVRRARRGSRSSPRRGGTAGRLRTRARAGAGGGGRCRRASRRRRGRRAPRRRRRSGGWKARRPSGRGAAARPRGACPGWSGSRFDHLRICQRRSPSVSPS